LHLHHSVAIEAMQAGKHVLTEKLMGQTVGKCKSMGRVAHQKHLHLATGHQRHYSILYDNAVDTIKRGLLGDLHHIRAQWHRGNLPGHDSWSPPLPPPPGWEKDPEARKAYKLVGELVSWTRRRDRAKGAEFDKWAAMVAQKEAQIRDIEVKAQNYGYEEITLDNGVRRSALEELIRWRLWNRTGGGLMAELGSHQLDAASIFISSQRDDGEKVNPLSVSAIGGRHIFPMDRDCDDHVYCIFEFPNKGYYKDFETGEIADPNKKIVVTYSSINGSGYGGYGEVVMGTKGTLVLEREQDVMLFLGSNTTTNVKVKNTSTGPTLDTTQSGGPSIAQAVGEQATAGPVSRGYTEEIEHWIWCIRELERESKGKSDFKPYEDLDPIQLPRCQPKVALADAVIALTANIAMDKRTNIEFKPEWFDIFSDETPEGVKPKA
jgi:predicted dehydrogenase